MACVGGNSRSEGGEGRGGGWSEGLRWVGIDLRERHGNGRVEMGAACWVQWLCWKGFHQGIRGRGGAEGRAGRGCFGMGIGEGVEECTC